MNLCFNIPLDAELPKMLTGSNQKVRAPGVTCITWVTRRHRSLGIQNGTYVTRKGIGVEHGNVVELSRRKKVTREGADDSASMRVRK